MLSRDEEMLAQHIRKAIPGTLAVVLTGELHSLLRAERERWAAEMASQRRDHRKAVAGARAEGYARAREQVAKLHDGEAVKAKETAHRYPFGTSVRERLLAQALTMEEGAKRIRAMQDERAGEAECSCSSHPHHPNYDTECP